MTPRVRQALVLVAAVATIWATTSLGLWQLRRADDKLARQAALAERASLPALGNAELACTGVASPGQANRKAVLIGHWLPEHTWLLDNRAMGGRAGFYVVTALQLEGAGPCASQVLMVQRGWVPRNAQNRMQVPPFITPRGTVRLQGRLVPEVSRAYSLGADLASPPSGVFRIVQNIDMAGLSAQMGRAVRPVAVLQLTPETGQAGHALSNPAEFSLLRDWPAPASDVGKHHAYAAQWFAMAALTTGLYVWFQFVSPRRRRSS